LLLSLGRLNFDGSLVLEGWLLLLNSLFGFGCLAKNGSLCFNGWLPRGGSLAGDG
jgi:hypothetical protein